jgi:PAS domain S-box-containing protein
MADPRTDTRSATLNDSQGAALRDETERGAHEQAELVAAAGDLVGALEIQEQLQRLARRAHRLAGADYAAVATVDDDGRTVWQATDGMSSDAWRTTVFPVGRGTAGRILAANAPVVITGFPDNPEFPRSEFPAHSAEGMRTAFGVPLRAEGRAFGAIVVGWRRDVPVPDRVVTHVQALADLAALAIVRSRLLEAAQQRAAQLEAFNVELEAQRAQLEEQTTELEMLNTELQERNHELDARVAELDAVLDQMADGVLIADARGEFVRHNPSVERIYGRPLAGVASREWIELLRIQSVSGEPLTIDALPTRRALAERRIIEGAEWTAERPDGRRIRLLGSASPLQDAQGRLTGVVLVFRDVTERAMLVEQVQKATQLKERFFAQMSHELRTPINAILGYSNLIADGLAGELPAQAQEMIGRIRRSGRHLLELVNDVLDISRLEAGKIQIDPTEFDLVELARDTMTSVEPQARDKGLALAVDAPESLRLCSDPARVRQVLLNLASNAVKFTERGEVRIVVEPCADGRVALRVSDTGPGIAPADQENVFAEFVQVGPRQKRLEGTGLGLAISRRLARLLGGELSLRSELGKGSTFSLLLPAAGPPTVAPPAAQSASAKRRFPRTTAPAAGSATRGRAASRTASATSCAGRSWSA